MGLILLEALLALVLLVGIVWWTMFSGRSRGELARQQQTPEPPRDSSPAPQDPPSATGAAPAPPP